MAKSMKVLTAKRAGFCFGVKRAVDIAFDAARQSDRVYTLGPIIHNPQVIEKLASQGVKPTESIDKPGIRTLIIRTHGVPRELSDSLGRKRYEIIDATCPFVKKAQEYAQRLREGGYQVIIIGDREHPEVQGLMSYAGPEAVVLAKNEPVPKLKSRVGVIVQTTQPVSVLKEFVAAIIDRVKELKVHNTICNSTALRLKETREIASSADAVIVVGGRNSANTTQLANLCRSLEVETFHIETADELQDEWFSGMSRVGITAGASTPDWIIAAVEDRIRRIGERGQDDHAGQ